MSLTPADVHNVAFSKPPIGKRGYNEDEVDAFLDLVEGELARLIEENNDLRAQVEQLDAQLESARADLDDARTNLSSGPPTRVVDEPVPSRRLTPVPPPSALEQTNPGAGGGDHHVQAAKVLGLAQEMADRLTGEAKAESDGMLAEARTKAEQLMSEARAKSDTMINESRTRAETMLNDARTRAETLTREARDKATALEREAQRKHTELIGSAQQERLTLEKKLDTLRTFEREYRTRLKTLLQSSLRELEDRAPAAPSSEGSRSASQQGYSFGPRAAEAG
ncbi:DivIVA domain-containing protein [Kibdelosporangium philippinense]|uniref:Cell wall synthesis protein Wag31 n=2 Tax=Kibdelosporangium TaxID=2029 RepID=A0A1W2ELU2_KIBAR|nr:MULTISPECIES: DivIVA domain-containing protein [Kibdelosporangium]MCE7007460.1 DivIVA domain-containing protein [Kibdelosporangium philippinense]RSM83902.1 DivIVA domain-containing protein [Kibdelosporangium aridum]SMD10634.1 DivIVA domain-containing protein [Kibdelosporangium aridum]